MKTQEKLNMTMLCDFYELTMGNGYTPSAIILKPKSFDMDIT